ncbi:50S ribosomal protein L17, partial [Bienertia sinuspersici]
QVYSIALCGDLVLTGSSSHRIHVWQSLSHALLEKGYIQTNPSEVRAMMAQAWRLSEKNCIDSFIAHFNKIDDMIIHQQSGNLITCSSNGTIVL